MRKDILIIGKGSSGTRFQNILKYKNNIKIVSSKNFNKKKIKKKIFDLIILSSPSSFHFKHLKTCLNNSDSFLIEKPLTNNIQELKKINKFNFLKKKIFVNYNLRELNIIKKLPKLINNIKNKGKLNYCNFHCGYNLKYWRKKNVKKSVSYSKKLGGGAIFELSHELELIYNFFGNPNDIKSVSKKLSNSVKNVEDLFLANLYYKKKKLVVHVNLNFLDNYKKRFFEMNYTNCNVLINIANSTVTIYRKNQKKKISFKNNMNKTYLEIPYKILNKKYNNLCSLKYAIDLSKFILQIKNS